MVHELLDTPADFLSSLGYREWHNGVRPDTCGLVGSVPPDFGVRVARYGGLATVDGCIYEFALVRESGWRLGIMQMRDIPDFSVGAAHDIEYARMKGSHVKIFMIGNRWTMDG